jgi:DUF4097 and DUF4098 domain-containing protein YvlB
MPTFDTPHPIAVTIELPLGDVRITASDRADTVVDVRPSDAANDADVKAAEQTSVAFADDRLLVRAPKARPLLGTRRATGSIDVAIALHAGSDVEGSAATADFEADGRLGSCRLKTGLGRIRLEQAGALHVKSGAGDVTVDRATGPAEVTLGSGDLRVGELDATAELKNANGDTWVGVARGDTRLKSANGSIVVDRAEAGLVARSANGDVRAGDVARGAVVLETHIGDVEVGIREGTAAWLDINTVAGRVRNDLDESSAPDGSADAVEVRARTALGDVVIRRASASLA